MRSQQHGRADHDVDSGETRGHAPLTWVPFHTPKTKRNLGLPVCTTRLLVFVK